MRDNVVCVKGLCERVVCVCVRDNVCKELCLTMLRVKCCVCV